MSTLKVNAIQHTNGTAALTIDTSGRVSRSLIPAFSATGSNTNVDYAAGAIFQFNVADLNTGGHFNTTTYRFTAPLAGLYLFGSVLYNNSSLSACFAVNGTQTYGTSDPHPLLRSTTTPLTTSMQILLSLSANDIVDVRSRDVTASSQVYMGHSNFWGFFVG